MSLFDISLEMANRFYTWGWRLSLGGAVITAIGVGILFWGTRVRDRDFEHNMAELNSEAGQARERAGQLEERAAGLETETAKSNKATEELRKQNLELEKAVAPRFLEQGLTAQALERFAGTPFVVISPPDFEPKRAAGQIRWMLQNAKWARAKRPTGPSFFSNGVTVHVMGAPPVPN